MTGLAPLAIFVYRRAEHARRMLASVLRNPEAASSPIWIYCDGARGRADREAVSLARRAVAALAPAHAQVVMRDANLGLAQSIISAVGELVARYGRVIVIEDDLELSPVALDYFNRALERYRDEPRAMHVSGYMYPTRAALPETFFYREATCWGWATWARAWERFEPDGRKILRAVLDSGKRREFDIQKSIPFLQMLRAQVRGELDSWAIRWYGSLWLHGGLALHPGRSLVRNIGHDGTGEHCVRTTEFDGELGTAAVREFPERVEECAGALRAVVEYRREVVARSSLLRRIWHRLAG